MNSWDNPLGYSCIALLGVTLMIWGGYPDRWNPLVMNPWEIGLVLVGLVLFAVGVLRLIDAIRR